jgi:hypothetical protein
MNRHWGNIAENAEDPVFENWTVPDISNPEKIEAQFPVYVAHVKDNEYKVTWHLDNLKAWRNTRPETWDEFQDYEDYVEKRLKYALAMHPDQYTMRKTEHPDELFRFTIATRSNTKKRTRSPKTQTRRNNANAVPKFFLLNDIKEHFPVVWHKDPRDPKLLGIQLHMKKVQALAQAAGVPQKEFQAGLETRLIKALQASEETGAWHVLASMHRDYVCMLRLRK